MQDSTAKRNGPIPRPPSTRQVYFWNIAGSVCNSAATVVLTMVCSWVLGVEQTGVFSLCLATANMLRPIGSFELRNACITDARNEFPFSYVMGLSCLSNIFFVLFSFLFVFWQGYTQEKFLLAIILCSFVAVQNISDTFCARFQKEGYLNLAGKSLAGSMTLAMLLFSVFLAITKNLLVAAFIMVLVQAIWLALYDFPYARYFGSCAPKIDKKVFARLLYVAFPLFLTSFLQLYIINAQRYAINQYLNDTMQAIYGYLFLPVSVINLCSIFLFRPIITPISKCWYEKDMKSFWRYIRRQICFVSAITVVILVGAFFFGTPVMSFVFRTDLTSYRFLLLVALIGGSFSAFVTFAHNVIMAMRKQYALLIVSVAVAICVLFAAPYAVKHWGMVGAFGLYTLTMLGMMIILYAFIIKWVAEKKITA